LRFANLNQSAINKVLGIKSGYRFSRNVKRNHASQITSHYDIGNDFYKLWLDDTMTYTCAYFKQATDSLEAAQRQKIDHVLGKLQLQQGHTFVDIGCGWGNLVVRAAKLYGAKGLGVTLSQEQYKFATALAKKEGVSQLATFKCMDYLDLMKVPQQYDRVISVGILEHVGRNNHRNYFDVVDHLLAPGGISVLHSITEQTEVDIPAWIDHYIFPGGYVPSIREIVQILPEYDFHLTDYESLRMHYAMTLDEWLRRFESQLAEVRKLGYDERFIRMWRMYLVGSASAFRYGTYDLSQLVFTKGLVNDLPLTRAKLYV
jgi:cyclopropane-fatty-acyl-phospholipid synthase